MIPQQSLLFNLFRDISPIFFKKWNEQDGPEREVKSPLSAQTSRIHGFTLNAAG